jgi:hypothetical protein
MRNIGLFPILDSDEIFIDAHQAPVDRRKMSRLDSGATALIFAGMSVMRELGRRLRADRAPPRFEPCLPRPAKEPPAGPGWIHEIKHDGSSVIDQYAGHGCDQHRSDHDVDRFDCVAVPHQHVVPQTDTRRAALRHSVVAHQGPGFRSFGVISVAAVTAAEEKLRISLNGG